VKLDRVSTSLSHFRMNFKRHRWSVVVDFVRNYVVYSLRTFDIKRRRLDYIFAATASGLMACG
jgi:hypothetical protein